MGVAVLGILFGGLFGGLQMGVSIAKLNQERIRATQILQGKTDSIRLYTWEQINTEGFVPETFVELFYFLDDEIVYPHRRWPLRILENRLS